MLSAPCGRYATWMVASATWRESIGEWGKRSYTCPDCVKAERTIKLRALVTSGALAQRPVSEWTAEEREVAAQLLGTELTKPKPAERA